MALVRFIIGLGKLGGPLGAGANLLAGIFYFVFYIMQRKKNSIDEEK